jgi:hypothetical protein
VKPRSILRVGDTKDVTTTLSQSPRDIHYLRVIILERKQIDVEIKAWIAARRILLSLATAAGD